MLEDLVKRGVRGGGGGDDDDTDDDDDDDDDINRDLLDPLSGLQTHNSNSTSSLLQGYQQRQQQRELEREALRRQTRASQGAGPHKDKGQGSGQGRDIFQLSVDSHDIMGGDNKTNNGSSGSGNNNSGSGGGGGGGGGSLGGITSPTYPTYPRPSPATWTSAFLQLLSPSKPGDGQGLDRRAGLFSEEEGGVEESSGSSARARVGERERGGLGLGLGASVDSVGGGDSPGGTFNHHVTTTQPTLNNPDITTERNTTQHNITTHYHYLPLPFSLSTGTNFNIPDDLLSPYPPTPSIILSDCTSSHIHNHYHSLCQQEPTSTSRTTLAPQPCAASTTSSTESRRYTPTSTPPSYQQQYNPVNISPATPSSIYHHH